MRPEVKAHLIDIQSACELILEFASRKQLADYVADAMLRSAIERQFITIGEAMSRLRDDDVVTAEAITDHRQIVKLRHILAHGYDKVSDARLWSTAQVNVPILLADVRALLSAGGG